MSKIVKVQSHDIRQLGINPNHWYVVALSPEVKTQPVGVMLWKQAMGEAPPGTAIALYCDSKGPIHALEDRCPDRLVKLSHGQVLGDELECAYHGWRFNDKSECAAVPYLADNQKLPSCKIRRYPVKEQDGFIWLFPENVETRRQSRHEGDPFGFASRLRRETLLQRWSHLLQRWLAMARLYKQMARLYKMTRLIERW